MDSCPLPFFLYHQGILSIFLCRLPSHSAVLPSVFAFPCCLHSTVRLFSLTEPAHENRLRLILGPGTYRQSRTHLSQPRCQGWKWRDAVFLEQGWRSLKGRVVNWPFAIKKWDYQRLSSLISVHVMNNWIKVFHIQKIFIFEWREWSPLLVLKEPVMLTS